MLLEKAESTKLEVLIVGAGLGGLSAAVACALAGHHATVLERSPELAEIGAGLQLGANATRILEEYGLGQELAKVWTEPRTFAIKRYSDGKVLYQNESWDVEMREKYGAPFIDVHRAQLQLLLYRRALELGVDVVLGAKVRSISVERAEIILDSGVTYTSNLLVGADGLWSMCRQTLLGHESFPQPTGDLAYRIILSVDQVNDDEELRGMILNPACRLWIGPQSHVVAYSIKGGTILNLVLLVPDDLPEGVAKQAGDADEMRALFRDWDPILTRLLDHVVQVEKWKLMHLGELETWKNEHGNFILLGDSSHPMLPYLVQGASSALEDGAALGKILEEVASPSQLFKATEIWQQVRKQRSEFLARQSSAQRDSWHLPNGTEQQKRDLLLSKEPAEGFPSRWVDPQVQSSIFGYNALEAAASAATQLSTARKV